MEEPLAYKLLKEKYGHWIEYTNIIGSVDETFLLPNPDFVILNYETVILDLTKLHLVSGDILTLFKGEE